jgi:hypothetical protein
MKRHPSLLPAEIRSLVSVAWKLMLATGLSLSCLGCSVADIELLRTDGQAQCLQECHNRGASRKEARPGCIIISFLSLVSTSGSYGMHRCTVFSTIEAQSQRRSACLHQMHSRTSIGRLSLPISIERFFDDSQSAQHSASKLCIGLR